MTFSIVLQQLDQSTNNETMDFEIMVEVYSVTTRKQIVDLYIEVGRSRSRSSTLILSINTHTHTHTHTHTLTHSLTQINKSQPVLEIDVPDVIATSKKRLIDQACAALHQKYKACFSNSTACQKPNVNLPTLRNALFHSKVIDYRSITSSGELLKLLEKANAKLMARPQDSWAMISNARALAKARCKWIS